MNKTIKISALVTTLLAACVAAQAQTPGIDTKGSVGYVIDGRNYVAKSGFGLCWRTGSWTPAMAIAECDPDLVKKEEPKKEDRHRRRPLHGPARDRRLQQHRRRRRARTDRKRAIHAARGRYMVYLLDEVHMLSKSAFNALLKTLEEPPGHAKFLLATTDPQKLPVTVLSRCLQFNLKRLTIEQIVFQIDRILAAEAIEHDAESVREIARGGNGSLRDALSLLDQAIAYGGGALRADEVRSMLGTIDRSRVLALLDALVAGDAPALMREVEAVAEFAPDFGTVLDELATLLHRLQLVQFVPDLVQDDVVAPALAAMSTRLPPDEVQLLYQLAVTGRRDLGLAPNPRAGFEMSLLRMLAFRPLAAGQAAPAAAPAAPRAAPPVAGPPSSRASSVPPRRPACRTCLRATAGGVLVRCIACSKSPVVGSTSSRQRSLRCCPKPVTQAIARATALS